MSYVKLDSETSLPFLRSAAKALQDENARLRKEAKATSLDKAELERSLAEAALQGANHLEALQIKQAEALELREELVRLTNELQVLKELLDLRTKALYGRKTERRPFDKNNEGKTKREKKERKEQTGHGPTAQPELPKIEVTHTLVDESLKCAACGAQMEPMGSEVEESELVAIEKRRIVLERHLRTKYTCKCGGCLKTAPGPLKLVPGGRYALNFAIHVAFLKYFSHLPLERQVHMMKHEGLRVTNATLCDQLDALATALSSTYEAIWKDVQGEEILRADETPWAVMSNGHNPNERFYAWVAVGSKYVAFRLLDTRSKEGASTILGDFDGTLMVDGLTSYPAAAKGVPGQPPRFGVANCMAHARRPFVECEKYYPLESGFALALFGQLYAIERDGKEPGCNLGALRNEKSRPLVDALFTWAKEQQTRGDILPSSGFAKALGYLVNHEAGLRVFLDDARVPIDNNESERAVRGPVLGRVNYYGSRSRQATQVAAIIYTLVESAKRCGVSPEAYLQAAAETALLKAGAVLLPDEFKRQLDAVRDPPIPTA